MTSIERKVQDAADRERIAKGERRRIQAAAIVARESRETTAKTENERLIMESARL